LRRGLVVFQFVIAQVLIIGTLVIAKQMSFFVSQPVGFDKEAIVNIPLPVDSLSKVKYNFIKEQLQNIHGIQEVTINSNTPIEDNNDMWTTFIFNHEVKRTDFYAIVKMADNDYVPTYKLPLIAGRNVEKSDTLRDVLVNEMLLKNLNIPNPQDALNKEIAFNDNMKGRIVGVLKNFNTRSFRDGLAPLVIITLKDNYREASVKLATNEVAPVMKSIEKLWNSTYPDFVYEYKFLDDKIAGFYKQENQLSRLYTLFACIAIFLSCLGLYGLASFMAVQRIKEVGIRKVLGATATNIVYIFSKEFVLLISIAFAIATPVAWYFMHQWLQHFSFRIELSWWLFAVTAVVVVFIALFTVSFQAIKAAIANPVKSLRTE
jgi:ABC-type antimicrobial peptide transport system permease subunit